MMIDSHITVLPGRPLIYQFLPLAVAISPRTSRELRKHCFQVGPNARGINERRA